MEIKANDYEIKMNHDELWDIAIIIRRSLISTIEGHWINNQKDWQKHEQQRLALLKQMFYALNKPEFFDNIEAGAEDIFTAFNKKRGTNKELH